MDAHVHCGECRREIALYKVEDGEVVEIPIEVGTQFVLRQVGPQQLEPVPIPVPLCDACAAKLKKQEAKVSKLIVPQAAVPPNLKPQ